MTEVETRDGLVTVRFADRETVAASPDKLLPDYASWFDWSKIELDPPFALNVPLIRSDATPPHLPSVADIPPTAVREATDPLFRAYMAWAFNYSGSRIGRWLRLLRMESGMSLRQMADLIGMQPKNLSQIEQGRVDPSIGKVARILGALDLGWDALTIPKDFPGWDEINPKGSVEHIARAVAEVPAAYQA